MRSDALLTDTIKSIMPVDKTLAFAARAHLDDLIKPQGSLGQLEDMAARLYLIAGGGPPVVDPARIYTIAGDHGVVEAGVSCFPQEVTRQMVDNFLNGGAGISVLTRTAGVDSKIVDMGSLGGAFATHPDLIQMKVAQGTRNLAKEAAMTRQECLAAVAGGINLAHMGLDEGYKALGTGDMGIGNTTPATALYCACFGLSPHVMTGPGAGLNSAQVRAKAAVIKQALALHQDIIEKGDPVAVLAALGGLEIAGLTGLILGGAACGMPVVIDGFISTAAAVMAWKMAPFVLDYLFFSHASAEPGHTKALEALQAKPLLDLGLRLGEGTGSALALFFLRAACDIFNDMATFSAAGVSQAT